LDTESYVVQRTGLTIPLRPKVFQVLHYLLRHRDRVISKQELQEQTDLHGMEMLAAATQALRALGECSEQPVLQCRAGECFPPLKTQRPVEQGEVGPHRAHAEPEGGSNLLIAPPLSDEDHDGALAAGEKVGHGGVL